MAENDRSESIIILANSLENIQDKTREISREAQLAAFGVKALEHRVESLQAGTKELGQSLGQLGREVDSITGRFSAHLEAFQALRVEIATARDQYEGDRAKALDSKVQLQQTSIEGRWKFWGIVASALAGLVVAGATLIRDLFITPTPEAPPPKVEQKDVQ